MNTSATGVRVLVTAGAAGIGRSIALNFAAAGAGVFVCDVDAKAVEALRAHAPEIGSRRADVSRPAEIEAMFAESTRYRGGLDVLVNNAGIAGRTVKAEDLRIEDWDRTIAVDLNGVFYYTPSRRARAQAAGGGSIINLSSIAGRFGYPLRSAYSAAFLATPAGRSISGQAISVCGDHGYLA
jgi:NAD(P)-dependent dehydrogenase (short-subunit alcohol dehydrogenase family)